MKDKVVLELISVTLTLISVTFELILSFHILKKSFQHSRVHTCFVSKQNPFV